MSNDGEGLLGRPVGELWVELEQDEKQDLCDYLIYCNNSDVMQEFVSQVRHRSYLKARRTGSLLSSKDARSGPVSSSAGETPSGGEKKRKNDGADLSDQAEKKAQISMFSGLATHTILPVSSSQTAPLPEPAAGGTPTTSATTSSNLNLSVLHHVAKSSQTPSIKSPTATVNSSRIANPQTPPPGTTLSIPSYLRMLQQ
ncbi:hypothetical protein N8I77_006721 [Diaporthe amygdali]|uniref:Uncharacterized protein n=1 Tax=Phomopsis amygdali TaxID=1214568 RepID=A0AAD9SHK1_PHOAM|nr:hypothetical protein N8I77_006721 [Diaporthe amygdali]